MLEAERWQLPCTSLLQAVHKCLSKTWLAPTPAADQCSMCKPVQGNSISTGVPHLSLQAVQAQDEAALQERRASHAATSTAWGAGGAATASQAALQPIALQLEAAPQLRPHLGWFFPPDLPRVEHLQLCPDGGLAAAALTFDHGPHERILEAFEQLHADIRTW